MRLLLVRHGQTHANVARMLDTAVPGADLTDVGHAQARALVGALEPLSLDGIYVSDLVRTHQTVAPLAAARGLTPVIRPGLREIQAGHDEMTPDPARWEAYLGVIYRWLDGDLEARMPGGETGAEVLARFDAVVAEVAAAHAESTALVVSHGAVIRAWAGVRAANVDRGFVADSRLGNTAVVVLDGSPRDGWRVVTWADTEPPGI
ncbi:MAG: histidine phosphatase family protein [Actinomycetota bacterium]|nr:histidine phosphatase family protein [Actinomycetota bacterium]